MAIKKTNFEPDVFGAAMPGQSLTANPGQFPYEKPPMTVDPEVAIDSLVETMREPAAMETIGHLLDAGISAETIASGYVLSGVAEGLFDADVAEITKRALIFYIVEIGDEMGIEEINVVDSAPPQGMDTYEGLELARSLSPDDRYEKKINKLRGNSERIKNLLGEHNLDSEGNAIPSLEAPEEQGFISRDRGVV